jgi:hypothetical protein
MPGEKSSDHCDFPTLKDMPKTTNYCSIHLQPSDRAAVERESFTGGVSEAESVRVVYTPEAVWDLNHKSHGKPHQKQQQGLENVHRFVHRAVSLGKGENSCECPSPHLYRRAKKST